MKIARLSDQSKSDLVAIWEYIAQDSPSAANRFVQRLVKEYKSLSKNPGTGRSRDQLRPGLRSFPVGNYLILYRQITEGIAVIRILHGARDLEVILEQEQPETFRYE